MKNINKTYIQLIIATFTIIVGLGMLLAGLIIPPIGIIHNSVLIAFGEIATFVGALLGIDYKYRITQNR